MSFFEKIRVEDLTLYAINTSAWYDLHCALARKGEPVARWHNHVKATVWRTYHKAFPNSIATIATLEETASELQDYYMQHISETEGKG